MNPRFCSRERLVAELTREWRAARAAGVRPVEACVGWLEANGLEPIVVPGISDGSDPTTVATLASGRYLYWSAVADRVEIGRPWIERLGRDTDPLPKDRSMDLSGRRKAVWLAQIRFRAQLEDRL